MTLNLWGANRWEDRRSAVVDWVNEVQPDLLALQEVVRTGGHCQASWIAARTQMTALFGAASSSDGSEFGNAVLSRLPIRDCHRHRLTDAATGTEPRALVTAEADACGRSIWFSSTHLSWRLDEGWVRERQVRDIVDIVGPLLHDLPPIVCGDFNATPQSTEVQFMAELHLVDAFEAANPGRPGYTWSNANPFAAAEQEPDRRIDYIFAGVRVLSADVVCNEPRASVWPSDHFGVAAELLLPDCQ
jgi:endonuclease/exonuclease/phosphatase family metal-dependent hydrolase